MPGVRKLKCLGIGHLLYMRYAPSSHVQINFYCACSLLISVSKMSASGGPGAACWRCIHCGFLIPGLEPGTLECCPIPACKKKQQENTVQAEGAVAGGSALEAKQLPSKGSSSPSIKRTKVTSNGNFDDNDLTRTYRASSMVSLLLERCLSRCAM